VPLLLHAEIPKLAAVNASAPVKTQATVLFFIALRLSLSALQLGPQASPEAAAAYQSFR
jgi:hypothetical protein